MELVASKVEEDVPKLWELGHSVDEGLELGGVASVPEGVEVAAGRAGAGPGTALSISHRIGPTSSPDKAGSVSFGVGGKCGGGGGLGGGGRGQGGGEVLVFL